MSGIGATVAESCALAATIVAVVAVSPQLHRVIVRCDHSGVSVTSGVLGVATEVAWLIYTVRGGLWSAVPEAGLMAAANVTLVVALVRRGADARFAWRAGLMWAVVLCAAAVIGGPSVLAGTLAGAYAVQVTPAVWTGWVTPAPTGVATATWGLIGVEGVLWGIYGIAHADPATSWFGVIAIVASTAMLTRKTIVARRFIATHLQALPIDGGRRANVRCASSISTRPPVPRLTRPSAVNLWRSPDHHRCPNGEERQMSEQGGQELTPW